MAFLSLFLHAQAVSVFHLGSPSLLLPFVHFTFITELTQRKYCSWSLRKCITTWEFKMFLTLHTHRNDLGKMFGLLCLETWYFLHYKITLNEGIHPTSFCNLNIDKVAVFEISHTYIHKKWPCLFTKITLQEPNFYQPKETKLEITKC